MENNQTNEKQQDYELQAVPDSARKGFLPMFMIMMGFTFFSASMSVGGQLGIGLNMTKFIWALLIGNAILGVYTGILGYMGCKTGLTLDLMARHAFGKKGSWLCSAIITFTQMGWFGVSTASQESIAQNADDWQEAIQDYQGLYLVYVDCHI